MAPTIPGPAPVAALGGIGVSPGWAVGEVVHMPTPITAPAYVTGLDDGAVEAAVAEVGRAAAQVREEIATAATAASGAAREALDHAAATAEDPALVVAAQDIIRAQRITSARAVWVAGSRLAEELETLGGHLPQRARAVRDVRDRLVAALVGRRPPGVPDPGHPFVLVADDLSPAEIATLDLDRVLAVITTEGGPQSHTAILARAQGLPAVVRAEGARDLAEGTLVLVDGAGGVVLADPTPQQVARATALAARVRTFDGSGRTADGHLVPLLANVGRPADAVRAAAAKAEGVGLFRTEFCFLDRVTAPSIAEQVDQYRQVFAAFAGRSVVVRTLDGGADKPLPFLLQADEPNPALGVRGWRAVRHNAEVLESQLEAVALAADLEGAQVSVMAPMVSTVDETEDFVARCAAHGLSAGVMIEVPGAALMSGPMLASATFASIGTNDLAMYTMAADRGLGDLAETASVWQPAVLQLVAAACRGAAQQGRPMGVCGEAAGDPALAPVLVGLGAASLSMAPRALGDVAEVLRSVTLEECRMLAGLVLGEVSAEGARRLVRDRLPALAELEG